MEVSKGEPGCTIWEKGKSGDSNEELSNVNINGGLEENKAGVSNNVDSCLVKSSNDSIYSDVTNSNEDINESRSTEEVNFEKTESISACEIQGLSSSLEANLDLSVDDDNPELKNNENDFGIEQLLASSGKEDKKHIFILSSAGKPVYSRHGCEDKLVTLFGVMQALVSVVQDGDDSIQAINCGKTVIVFLSKGPIILVAVSSSGESKEFLKRQLDYVYNQVVSVLTLTQVTRIFEERHNYDLRRLLTGSERLIDYLLTFSETQPDIMLDGVSSLYMSSSARDAISNSIVTSCSKIKNIVFALLIGNQKLISLVKMKKYPIFAPDIHLICNLVSSSESFKTAESWTPICLPDFNPSGFLHAHVSYLSDEVPACLLLLTVERDSFFSLSEAKQKILEKLTRNQCMIVLGEALKRPPIKVSDIGLPLVKHFLFKCLSTSQIFMPEMPEQYNDCDAKRRELIQQYEAVHNSLTKEGSAVKLMFQQLNNYLALGWHTEKFFLYVLFEPLVSKSSCFELVDKILNWIQKEMDKLFARCHHTF